MEILVFSCQCLLIHISWEYLEDGGGAGVIVYICCIILITTTTTTITTTAGLSVVQIYWIHTFFLTYSRLPFPSPLHSNNGTFPQINPVVFFLSFISFFFTSIEHMPKKKKETIHFCTGSVGGGGGGGGGEGGVIMTGNFLYLYSYFIPCLFYILCF